MTQIDKSKPVLVTGATGYVAGWLVKKLLEEGIIVHAAVRNPDNKEKITHLDKIASEASGEIKYFKSDLLENGSYAEAIAGCELVFHTASPFTSNIKDPQKELIDPAKLGTRNVLEEASKTASVKRVVLTSSVAAIYGDNIDIKEAPNMILTEDIWNTSSSLQHNAYSYSKTLAEKEAWEISKNQSQWDLVVINPSLVIGPALNPKTITSESFSILKQFGDGSLKPGAPKLGIGVVDVREVAEAHFQAGYRPEAEGRHILSGHNTFFLDMAKALQPKYGKDYPLPKGTLPKWLIWIVGPFINKNMTRKFVSRNIGYSFKADHSKSQEKLGINYRSLEESMHDTFQQLIDEEIIKN
ncbi:MAG: NAD-dependent epimerase/dehydratase family protein [Bacteroidota bacterium]